MRIWVGVRVADADMRYQWTGAMLGNKNNPSWLGQELFIPSDIELGTRLVFWKIT